ncbi:MAG: Na+/H+ antiporter NhaA [Planctomycetota bacterium]|jgi:NhaA family Na+:H+ antiporter
MALEAVRKFIRLEASGGILLVIAAAAALVVANIPGLSGLYDSLLAMPVEVTLGSLELDKTFLLVVNDGLMAIFFLLIGLEIKREVLDGELSSISQIALPGIAAMGGIAVPAAVYAAMNWGDPVAMKGWAIPAATDIAFALGVLSLLGPRVPVALKIFLMALAVIDDLGAILIIAIFYSGDLSITAHLLAAGAMVVLIVMNRLGVVRLGAYFVVGTILWVCVLKSGVHATVAGVLLAMTIPLRAEDEEGHSPLRHLEHLLHPWAAFFILPVFAFANAGVSFAGITMEQVMRPEPLGIAAGLLVGKLVGVLLLSWIAIQVGLARLPEGVNWGAMLGVSLLCGIGFTMSLFIGTLAFEGDEPVHGVYTRVGVLGASVIAAVVGYLVLNASLPRFTAADDGG